MRGRKNLLILLGAVLLLTSVGLKVRAMGGVGAEGSEAQLAPIERFLVHEGFALRPDQRPAGPFVAAQRGDCHLIVGSLSPRGWHQGVVQGMAQPDDDLYFVVGGRIYAAQPTWRTRTLDAAARALTAAGFPHARPVVLGVITTGPCGSRSLPWGEISGGSDSADVDV